MSANFDSVTKYLDRSPSRIDTTEVTKPYDRRVSRAIKKLNYEFTIPRTTVNLATVGAQQGGCLIAQYNYTASRAFRVLKMTSELNFSIIKYAFIAIRYRVGTTVYRYRLPLSGVTALEAAFANYIYVQGDTYTNQRIQPNFAIEIWSLVTGQTNIDVGPFTVTTGLLRNPVIPEERSVDIPVLVEMQRGDLTQPFPEALPTPYGDGSCWLTN